MLVGALDIGGTKTIAGLIDGQGRIVAQRRFATDTHDLYAHLHACAAALRALMRDNGSAERLGVTMPGMVDEARGVLLNAAFAGWRDVDVRAALAQQTGLAHIRVENDVNACALAEQRLGHGRRYRHFIWMTVSTGVGGAVVADGRLLRGAWHCAGEVGHIKVEYAQPERCPCGGFGCLEAQGSGSAITRMTREAAATQPAFAARLAEAGLPQDGIGCAMLARAGDAAALAVYHRAAVYLGRGIAACVNVLNPQAVVLGGGVTGAFDLLYPELLKTVEMNIIGELRGVEIVKTALGYEAALLGAAALAKQPPAEA
jgi:glucokinase